MKSVLVCCAALEPNGLWLATGTHNYVLEPNYEAIGDPVVAHIQGCYDYPGVTKYMGSNGIEDGASENPHDDARNVAAPRQRATA